MMPMHLPTFRSIKKALRDSMQQMNRHFTDSRKEIARNNSMLMMTVSSCGLLLELLLLGLTPLLIHGWKITVWHWLMLPFFVCFAILGWQLYKRDAPYRVVHAGAMLFTFLLLLLVMCMDLLPYPTSSATIITVAMSIIPVLFIIPFHETVGLLAVVLTIFLVMNGQVMSPANVSMNAFHGILGCVCGIMVAWVVTNIRAEDNKDRQMILHESHFDALTGIANKAAVERICRAYLSERTEPCALIVLDVDSFKTVNDQYGHHMGDNVLQLLGGSIREVFRESDVCGRIGGDEFLVLMKGVRDEAIISGKMHTLMELVHRRVLDETGISVTCSYGAVRKAADEQLPYLTLFNMADKVLYHAKRSGKNCGQVMTVAQYNSMAAAKEIMLVVDDADVNREILKNIFENDFDVMEASNGVEAIQIIRKHHGIIGVMMLDIMMPEVGGFDVLQWIREQEDIEPFPIVTISSDSGAEQQSFELGVADMITKPFNPEVVRMRVARVIKDRHK